MALDETQRIRCDVEDMSADGDEHIIEYGRMTQLSASSIRIIKQDILQTR